VITLDRDAPLSIGDQLVDALRYEIAAGRYRPGERLPSTRVLGEQVGISFHTVRKAYQKLEAEGVLDVRRGGGFFVAERQALTRAERLERAAGVVQDALHKLVGLGLNEDEVEYVVEEQLQFFERPGPARSLLFAAPYRELAESGAEQCTSTLQERTTPVLLSDLHKHAGADGVVVPLPALRDTQRMLPAVEVVGVAVAYPHAVLEPIARLMATEALGLVTRHADAVAPLSDEIRALTGFGGTLSALPVDADRRQVDAVIRQAALLVYTPQARRRVRPLLTRSDQQTCEIIPAITPESLARVRDVLGV
jgi:GntR family transcriptional regulator